MSLVRVAHMFTSKFASEGKYLHFHATCARIAHFFREIAAEKHCAEIRRIDRAIAPRPKHVTDPTASTRSVTSGSDGDRRTDQLIMLMIDDHCVESRGSGAQ